MVPQVEDNIVHHLKVLIEDRLLDRPKGRGHRCKTTEIGEEHSSRNTHWVDIREVCPPRVIFRQKHIHKVGRQITAKDVSGLRLGIIHLFLSRLGLQCCELR